MIDIAYVIPAFDAETTIVETLRSVLAQRGPRVHAIVVDDGSSDATGDVARSARDWRVEVVRQQNLGLAGARNTGLEVLQDRAPVVCFLDADDTVEAGHARALCAALAARGARERPADLAACSYRMVGPSLEDLGWTIDVAAGDVVPSRLIESNPLAVGAVAVSVEALRAEAGPRPFDEALPVHEDWDLWLRLSDAGCRWTVLQRGHMFNYRLRAGSLSRRVELMWRVGQRVIEAAPMARGEGAQRLWTVRHLARAAVAAPGLVPVLLDDLDTRGGRALGVVDRGAFLGSLRHAFMLEHAKGPEAAHGHQEEWRARAATALAAWPEAREVVGSLAFGSWEAMADRIGSWLASDGRARAAAPLPVIAGMGRNGRALALAMAARGLGFEWYDEAPDAAVCPVPAARRLGLAQLTPRHVVIVTPVSPGDLGARLRTTPAQVMLPSDLLRPDPGFEAELSTRLVA